MSKEDKQKPKDILAYPPYAIRGVNLKYHYAGHYQISKRTDQKITDHHMQ